MKKNLIAVLLGGVMLVANTSVSGSDKPGTPMKNQDVAQGGGGSELSSSQGSINSELNRSTRSLDSTQGNSGSQVPSAETLRLPPLPTQSSTISTSNTNSTQHHLTRFPSLPPPPPPPPASAYFSGFPITDAGRHEYWNANDPGNESSYNSNLLLPPGYNPGNGQSTSNEKAKWTPSLLANPLRDGSLSIEESSSNTDLAAQLGRSIEELKKENDELQKKYNQAFEEAKDSAIAEYVQQFKESEELHTKEKKEFLAEKEKLQEEQEKLRKQLEETKSNMEQQINELKRRMEDDGLKYKVEKENGEKENSKLKAEMEEKRKHIEELEKRLNDELKNNSDYENLMNEAAANLVQQGEEIKNLEKELEKSQKEARYNKMCWDGVLRERETVYKNGESYLEMYRDADKKLKEEKQRSNKIESELRRATKEKENLLKQIEDTKREMTESVVAAERKLWQTFNNKLEHDIIDAYNEQVEHLKVGDDRDKFQVAVQDDDREVSDEKKCDQLIEGLVQSIGTVVSEFNGHLVSLDTYDKLMRETRYSKQRAEFSENQAKVMKQQLEQMTEENNSLKQKLQNMQSYYGAQPNMNPQTDPSWNNSQYAGGGGGGGGGGPNPFLVTQPDNTGLQSGYGQHGYGVDGYRAESHSPQAFVTPYQYTSPGAQASNNAQSFPPPLSSASGSANNNSYSYMNRNGGSS